MTRLLIASTVLLLTQPLLQAQVKLEHAPNWAKGDKSRIEVNTTTKQTLTLAGMPVDTKADQFMIMNEVVLAANADGSTKMQTEFETFQSDLSLPGGLQVNYDKGNANNTAPIAQLEPLIKLYDALSKSKWNTEYASDGKVKSICSKASRSKTFQKP